MPYCMYIFFYLDSSLLSLPPNPHHCLSAARVPSFDHFICLEAKFTIFVCTVYRKSTIIFFLSFKRTRASFSLSPPPPSPVLHDSVIDKPFRNYCSLVAETSISFTVKRKLAGQLACMFWSVGLCQYIPAKKVFTLTPWRVVGYNVSYLIFIFQCNIHTILLFFLLWYTWIKAYIHFQLNFFVNPGVNSLF